MNYADGKFRPLKRCRSCNATVFWCRTRYGKRQIVNSQPVDAGDSLAGKLVIGADEVVYPATEDDVAAKRPLYVSHFSTCPHANQWRNRS